MTPLLVAALALLPFAPPPAGAGSPPPALQAADVEERLGAAVPRDLEFLDPEDRPVRLGDLLDGRAPLVLVLAYARCPTLCNVILRGLGQGLAGLDWTPGREYRVVTISLDHDERREDAGRKQDAFGALVGKRGGAWPFLRGRAEDVRTLADAVGFRYQYDERTDQWAHPAVAIVLAPDGRVSRYLYGVSFAPRDVRLALLEASAGRIGSLGDRILFACYRWDPSSRRYGLFISRFMKVGAALIFLVFAGVLVRLWRRELEERS